MKKWGPERKFHRKIHIQYVFCRRYIYIYIYILVRVYMPECISVCFQMQDITTNLPTISSMKQDVIMLFTVGRPTNQYTDAFHNIIQRST